MKLKEREEIMQASPEYRQLATHVWARFRFNPVGANILDWHLNRLVRQFCRWRKRYLESNPAAVKWPHRQLVAVWAKTNH